MKVIDLLNKIANGEASDLKTYFIFEGEKYNYYQFSKIFAIDINSLNFEVEIIEEDKKIGRVDRELDNDGYLSKKLNEIIDKLNAGVDKE